MKRFPQCTFAVVLLLLVSPAFAADTVPPATIHIPKVERPPTLEEFLGMAPTGVGLSMAKVDVFTQLDPKEGDPAQEKTEVYLGYDAKNFYAVWICFDKDPKKIRARMARREDINSEHDEVQLYLDTFNDHRRSYGFMINPIGIQYDYIWTDNNGYDGSWDTVWNSSGKVTGRGYVAMMSIPFRSLRFSSAKVQTWGILLQRVVPHDNDNSFNPALTRKIQGRLTQEGTADGLENLYAGRNMQFVPYATAGGFHVVDDRNSSFPFFHNKKIGTDAGLDAKFVLKNSLVLDVTVNPDFRQVESDEPQTTVNQRFEVFFPEKRPFFQENANFFDTPISLYFTRRIIDPQFGLRLTGKVGEKWGVGLLAIDDQSPGRVVPNGDADEDKRAYFYIARVTREFWKQSHIGIFYGDREFDGSPLTSCGLFRCLARSNRVGGLDGRLRFGNNFYLDFQGLASSTDYVGGTHNAGPSFNLYGQYSTRKIFFDSAYNDTAAGFHTATGFFRRPDFRRKSDFFQYRFWRENKIITRFGPQVFTAITYDHAGNRLEYVVEPGFQIIFRANTDIGFFQGSTSELLRPSDFSTLTRNTDYKKGYWGLFFDSSYFKWMSIHANYNPGKAINFDPPSGQAPFLSNEQNLFLGITLHPLNPLTIDNTYLLDKLANRDTHRAIFNSHIFRSRWNYQITKELSIRTILQYNSVLPEPTLSSLDKVKNFNADLLVTYLVHPGTAFYVGYNSNQQNLDPAGIYRHTGLFRTGRSYMNDGRIFFVKVSWMFRY